MTGSATSVYLPSDLRSKVQRAADAQGRSASSIIVEAVRVKLARGEDGADPVTLRHIARLEARIDKAVRDGMLMKETLLLFVRVWLEHNPPKIGRDRHRPVQRAQSSPPDLPLRTGLRSHRHHQRHHR